MIGLDILYPYPVTPLSLGQFMTKVIGVSILNMVMCTPILAGSGLKTARYVLRTMDLMTYLGLFLPFQGVLLSLVPLPLIHLKNLALNTFFIFAFPDKTCSSGFINFHIKYS